MTLGRLDYLYTPSDDVAADLRYFVDVLGATLGFAIEDAGIRVAMVELGGPPAILLTDHLEGDRPIHLYAVDDVAVAVKDLAARGWKQERSVEPRRHPTRDLPARPTLRRRVVQGPSRLRLSARPG
jgi:hypothetical protein